MKEHLHHAWKTSDKQLLTYLLTVTVFLPPSGMVVTWLNFSKKPAVICLETLLFLWNFTGGFFYEDQDRRLLVRMWVVLVYPSWAKLSKMRELPPPNFLCKWMHQSTRPHFWGRYHGGRRPSSDDSFHSPTVIPLSALDKQSIMKHYHRRRATKWGVTARSPTMGNVSWYSACRVPIVEWRLDCENCRHLTVVGLHDTGPCSSLRLCGT